ncbi:MAG: SDR family oxidoreductase [Dokdonella sp.]
MNLAGKTIVITGAAQGIGRALAVSFADHGSDLALLDLREDGLEETKALCSARGVKVNSYAANVSEESQVEAAMGGVVEDFGRLDGIINNAGIIRDALLVKSRDGEINAGMTLEQWRAVIDVNLTGVFLCGRAAGVRMARLGNGGVIVNISSISRHGNIGQSNYSAAKAGVAALAEVWGKELARYGIRAGSIAPGFVNTDIVSTIRPEVLDKLISAVPLGRLGEADEIAMAARFIFENDFFTGRCIDLDGGLRL